MSRRPLEPPVGRLAKAQNRMAPGGLLWSEAPIPRQFVPRVPMAGEDPLVPTASIPPPYGTRDGVPNVIGYFTNWTGDDVAFIKKDASDNGHPFIVTVTMPAPPGTTPYVQIVPATWSNRTELVNVAGTNDWTCRMSPLEYDDNPTQIYCNNLAGTGGFQASMFRFEGTFD